MPVTKGSADKVRSEMMADRVFMLWQVMRHVESVFQKRSSQLFQMVCGKKACKSLSPVRITNESAIVLLIKTGQPGDEIAKSIAEFVSFNGWAIYYEEGESIIILQPDGE